MSCTYLSQQHQHTCQDKSDDSQRRNNNDRHGYTARREEQVQASSNRVTHKLEKDRARANRHQWF